jgi:hypothetical protein
VEAPLVISSASLEYVKARVFAKMSGAVIDPTADVVTMAFLASDADPVSGDFKAASWETDTTTDPDSYFARCLVGPGGAATLTDGIYTVWVKIADSPEIPVKRAGQVIVH